MPVKATLGCVWCIIVPVKATLGCVWCIVVPSQTESLSSLHTDLNPLTASWTCDRKHRQFEGVRGDCAGRHLSRGDDVASITVGSSISVPSSTQWRTWAIDAREKCDDIVEAQRNRRMWKALYRHEGQMQPGTVQDNGHIAAADMAAASSRAQPTTITI